jgi:hypothetical protein
MKALEISPGNWAAVDRGLIVRHGFPTSEAAWAWIDRNGDAGRADTDRHN